MLSFALNLVSIVVLGRNGGPAQGGSSYVPTYYIVGF